MLEAEAVPGALADLHVGEQPEQCPAPVGAAPGVRPIETFVTLPRQPLRKAAHQVAPHLLRAQLAGPRPRDRLDVGGETFLHPEMAARLRGKAEMHHLVNELPAPARLREVHLGAEEEEDGGSSSPTAAAVNLVTGCGQDEQQRAVDREAPEVARDERRRAANPLEQLFFRLAARCPRDGHGGRPALDLQPFHAELSERCVGQLAQTRCQQRTSRKPGDEAQAFRHGDDQLRGGALGHAHGT